RIRRTQRTALGGIPQVARIHGDQEIRRCRVAFGKQLLDERLLAVRRVADRHTRFRGVRVEDGLDQLFGARRVHHHRPDGSVVPRRRSRCGILAPAAGEQQHREGADQSPLQHAWYSWHFGFPSSNDNGSHYHICGRCAEPSGGSPEDDVPGGGAGYEKRPRPRRTRPSRIKSLAMTYSRMGRPHTTIGAERFHFRVRDGIGWFPLAIAARQTGSQPGKFLTFKCRTRAARTSALVLYGQASRAISTG